MKIIITGATGFIGQQLVPLLENAGAEICLIGRSVEKMKKCFPNKKCETYKNINNIADNAVACSDRLGLT